MTAADLDRLKKLAGLLGSDHEGERASAAALATALLRKNKLTWGEVIHIEGEPKAEPEPQRPPPWERGDDLDLGLIPRSSFPNDLLRRYIDAFIAERERSAKRASRFQAMAGQALKDLDEAKSDVTDRLRDRLCSQEE